MRRCIRRNGDAVAGYCWRQFYSTGVRLTTEGLAACPAGAGTEWFGGTDLFRRHAAGWRLPSISARHLARLSPSGSTSAAVRALATASAALRERDLARQRRADHARLDRRVIGEPARMGVAIALDQPRAFGDLEREIGRAPRRLDDQREPGFDRASAPARSGGRRGAARAAWRASGNADSR